NLGLTNSYTVKNGIDQGETITPLFWRIYYDPLISKIANHFYGYTLNTSWKTSLSPPKSQNLQTSISVLAYMDDTLWMQILKMNSNQLLIWHHSSITWQTYKLIQLNLFWSLTHYLLMNFLSLNHQLNLFQLANHL